MENPDRFQGMVRSLTQWENMVPLAVMSGSMAQIEYALRDAKHDIAVLSQAIAAAYQQGKQDGHSEAAEAADVLADSCDAKAFESNDEFHVLSLRAQEASARSLASAIRRLDEVQDDA